MNLTPAQRRRAAKKARSRKRHEHQPGVTCGVCHPNSVKGVQLPGWADEVARVKP